VESVGAAGDEADVVVDAFGTGFVYLQSDGGEDSVEELGGVVGVEVTENLLNHSVPHAKLSVSHKRRLF
jgi:hypothetical protein